MAHPGWHPSKGIACSDGAVAVRAPEEEQAEAAEHPVAAFEQFSTVVDRDMRLSQDTSGPPAVFRQTDARTCEGVPLARVNLVLTSPPYPNNYDYADATRLEMSFMPARLTAGATCKERFVIG